MYLLFRFASLLSPRLPRRLVPGLGTIFGTLVWLLAGQARKQATHNIRQVTAFQRKVNHADCQQLRRAVRRLFCYSVRNYLDAFALPALEKEAFLHRVSVHGLEHLDAALALGKGVILFSAHLGPFNELVHWLALNGYPTTIPVEHLKDERILKLMLDLRRSHGINFIALGGSAPLRALLAALRHNQIVLIPADRAIEGPCVAKPFFGANAYFPLGPVHLAQRTGAALVGGFGWYSEGPSLEARCVPLSLDLPEEQRGNEECLMKGMVKILEQFVGAHPEQWMIFSPIWTERAACDTKAEVFT